LTKLAGEEHSSGSLKIRASAPELYLGGKVIPLRDEPVADKVATAEFFNTIRQKPK
jgi:hypothetical protein